MMSVPKYMVGVNGDNGWLFLIVACAFPGLLDVACCKDRLYGPNLSNSGS